MKPEFVPEPRWLGKLLGTGKGARLHMAVAILIVVFLAGGAVILVSGDDRMEMARLLLPLMTFCLGYVLGTADRERE